MPPVKAPTKIPTKAPEAEPLKRYDPEPTHCPGQTVRTTRRIAPLIP